MSKTKKVLIRNKEDYFKAKKRIAFIDKHLDRLHPQGQSFKEYRLLLAAITEYNNFYKVEAEFLKYAGLELVEDEG